MVFTLRLIVFDVLLLQAYVVYDVPLVLPHGLCVKVVATTVWPVQPKDPIRIDVGTYGRGLIDHRAGILKGRNLGFLTFMTQV